MTLTYIVDYEFQLYQLYILLHLNYFGENILDTLFGLFIIYF